MRGLECGMTTSLFLPGVNNEEMMKRFSYQPDFISNGILLVLFDR